jgi:hypothetical protein
MGRDTKAHDSGNPNAPLLRRIAVKHIGFTGDAALNDAIVDEEQKAIWKNPDESPKVETPYNQTKVDHMKEVLRDFWKERGITVEVRTTLTQVPNAPRYAALEFDVYRVSP